MSLKTRRSGQLLKTISFDFDVICSDCKNEIGIVYVEYVLGDPQIVVSPCDFCKGDKKNENLQP